MYENISYIDWLKVTVKHKEVQRINYVLVVGAKIRDMTSTCWYHIPTRAKRRVCCSDWYLCWKAVALFSRVGGNGEAPQLRKLLVKPWWARRRNSRVHLISSRSGLVSSELIAPPTKTAVWRKAFEVCFRCVYSKCLPCINSKWYHKINKKNACIW